MKGLMVKVVSIFKWKKVYNESKEITLTLLCTWIRDFLEYMDRNVILYCIGITCVFFFCRAIEAVEHSVIDGGSSSSILLMMLVSLLPYLLDGCSSLSELLI